MHHLLFLFFFVCFTFLDRHFYNKGQSSHWHEESPEEKSNLKKTMTMNISVDANLNDNKYCSFTKNGPC